MIQYIYKACFDTFLPKMMPSYGQLDQTYLPPLSEAFRVGIALPIVSAIKAVEISRVSGSSRESQMCCGLNAWC